MFSYELPDLDEDELPGMRVPEEIYVVDAFDHDPPLDGYDEDEAVWDNWVGEWVVARGWVWAFDVTAEGFARYDLRPVA